MAENSRTQTKAAIKRASIKARTLGNKLDRKALDEMTVIYKQAVADLRDIIKSYESGDGSVKLEVLNELLQQTTARLQQLSSTRDTLLDNKMVESAQLGISPFLADAGTSLVVTQVAHDAVAQIRNFVANDGLQLSDRIWRIDNHAKQIVTDAIQSAVIQGNSATHAALDLINTGQNVPRDVAAKMATATGDSIARTVKNGIFGDGSPYDNALRLFRTEINRAHGNAYQAAAFDNPEVAGTRFLLSPNHPKHDICDMHASVNRYGLGPGVYPKNKNPWPAHPNTLSYVEAVFKDEVTEEDRAGKIDRISWLKQRSPVVQSGVLGIHKAALLRNGLLEENQITTPWKILDKRLQNKGIFFNALDSSTKRTATGEVSKALDILGYQKEVDHTLKAIDKTHTIGTLPVIPVFSSQSTKFNGIYVRRDSDTVNESIKIEISSIGDHKELTMAHELGHFIDHQAFDGIGMTSESHRELDNVILEAMKTPEIGRLLKGKRAGGIMYNKLLVVSAKDVDYLLTKREIWARAYSQWIALRSKDNLLLRQVDKIVKNQKTNWGGATSQWEPDNFTQIAKQIDDVFSKKEWLK